MAEEPQDPNKKAKPLTYAGMLNLSFKPIPWAQINYLDNSIDLPGSAVGFKASENVVR